MRKKLEQVTKMNMIRLLNKDSKLSKKEEKGAIARHPRLNGVSTDLAQQGRQQAGQIRPGNPDHADSAPSRGGGDRGNRSAVRQFHRGTLAGRPAVENRWEDLKKQLDKRCKTRLKPSQNHWITTVKADENARKTAAQAVHANENNWTGHPQGTLSPDPVHTRPGPAGRYQARTA